MRNVVRTSDIVVVGAGIVGATVAYELTCRGASVTIVDARTPGAGATHASGGMLAPFTEADEDGPLLMLGARSRHLFRALVERVQADSGIDVNYRETGSLHVAHTDATLDHFDRTCAKLVQLGVPALRLSATDARVHEPYLADDIRGGLLLETQALVSAPALTHALITACQRRGATVLEALRVRRVGSHDAGSRISLVVDGDRERLAAGTVVLAAGSWTRDIAIDGAEQIPITPIRGQLLHLGWRGSLVSRITWDERCYVVPWQDGTLLVGATMEDVGFDEQTTASGVKSLLEAVCDLLPHASTAHLASARAGLRPATPDGLPVVGWSSSVPRLMYATGHYRNGVLLAPLTAQIVADAVLDDRRDSAFDVTDPARFGRL